MGLHRNAIKYIRGSSYKYVSLVKIEANGRHSLKWKVYIPYYKDGRSYNKLLDNEREAAIAVDKAFIRISKDPVNILKLKDDRHSNGIE